MTLSPDTPTIPSGFAEAPQAEYHSPPTSVFDGLQQYQYHTEVSTFSAALLAKPLFINYLGSPHGAQLQAHDPGSHV